MAGVYFSETTINYFWLGFGCNPYYRGVRYSWVFGRRELTVVWTTRVQKWNKWFTDFEHRVGAVGREGLVNYIPVLTPEYLLLSQWIPVLVPIYTLLLSSKYLFQCTKVWHLELIRYATLHLRDKNSASWLLYRNSTEITVLMCEQQPCPVGVFMPVQKLLSGIVRIPAAQM